MEETETKICTKCKTKCVLNDFYKQKGGYESECKACRKARSKSWRRKNDDKVKAWCEVNKEKRVVWNANWHKLNKDSVRIKSKAWHKLNKAKANADNKIWREENKNKLNAALKQRRKTDAKYRVYSNMSRHIRHSLKYGKEGKSWKQLVDYTGKDLRRHLEKQFTEGMTWENYGKWHIDHIIPISVFNFTKPEHEDFKRCWSLKNLQPLWAKDNITKSNKIEHHFQPSLLI